VSSEFATPGLRLTRAQLDTMLVHCYDGFPDEACGLLAGPFDGGEPTGLVRKVYPCRNADASARTYTVDSRDYLHAMRDAEGDGLEIVGVWHSHTHTDPYPSPTDVRQAVDPAWLYVIVSLKHGDAMTRAYRIRDEIIEEVPVEVDEGGE
jgi:[CysO sulfur-carrier protein]-S-L-cysteine hydrolase